MALNTVSRIVTDQVIEQLEQGTVPWHQPWMTQAPMRLNSKKPYRGLNILMLGVAAAQKGYSSSWWGTYNQIKELGGQVRRGEHGTMVIFWKRWQNGWETDETGYRVPLWKYVLRYYKVFNIEQADWSDGRPGFTEEKPVAPIEIIERAEKTIREYPHPPRIKYNRNYAAAYFRSEDFIMLPPREAFESSDEFYSTIFHELTHSTGHSSRLDRHGACGAFGGALYSKEELIAELGAAMLNAITGVNTRVTLSNNVAYIKGWLTVLHGDRSLIVQAASQAQRAVDHILGTSFGEEDGDANETI